MLVIEVVLSAGTGAVVVLAEAELDDQSSTSKSMLELQSNTRLNHSCFWALTASLFLLFFIIKNRLTVGLGSNWVSGGMFIGSHDLMNFSMLFAVFILEYMLMAFTICGV